MEAELATKNEQLETKDERIAALEARTEELRDELLKHGTDPPDGRAIPLLTALHSVDTTSRLGIFERNESPAHAFEMRPPERAVRDG